MVIPYSPGLPDSKRLGTTAGEKCTSISGELEPEVRSLTTPTLVSITLYSTLNNTSKLIRSKGITNYLELSELTNAE